jgi:hypothetical protein
MNGRPHKSPREVNGIGLTNAKNTANPNNDYFETNVGCLHPTFQRSYLIPQYYLLSSTVVDLSKEVFVFIGISIRSQPERENGPVSEEENGKETKIVDSEPFVGSLSSNGSGRGKDGGHESCKSGHGGLGYIGLLSSHGERGCGGACDCTRNQSE